MNTIGTGTIGTSWRLKYFSSKLQVGLRNILVAEKIMRVDNSDLKYIANPYLTQPTALIQAVTGLYSLSAWTITDDTLNVADEVIWGGHIFAFEEIMSNYDLRASIANDVTYAVAYQIDKFALNVLCEDGTGAYTTPAGGFTTASNIPVIMSNLASKVMGYQGIENGMYLVIENTDVPGFLQAQLTTGFSYADSALRNGFMTSYAGIDIYVVRTGTFVSATLGSRSDITNGASGGSGHRVFGIKNQATYASPRGIQYDEKSVSGKTGKEIVINGLIGVKVWTQAASLTVDITLP